MSLAQTFELLIPKARELCAGLSSDAFVWRPAPGAWSVAECIDHLNTSNELYLRQIADAIDAARRDGITGTGPFQMGWLERLFVASLEPPVKLRVKAPAKFKPVSGPGRDEIVAQWERTHVRAAELARAADGLHMTKVRIASPAAAFLKFSLLAVFHIIPAHDRRHLWQASRVAEQIPASVTRA